MFAAMAQKVTNDWKDHGWWIMAEAAQTLMLWITTYAVVEGRHWSAVGKVFEQILSITPSGTESLIFTVRTEGIVSPKIRLQKTLLFAPIPRICLEAQLTFRGLMPLQDLWLSMPEELQSARETSVERFVALSEEDVPRATRLHLEHNAYNNMRSNDPIRAVDQRPNDPEETDPMYRVIAAPITVNWEPPQGRGDCRRPTPALVVGDVESVPTEDTLLRRIRSRIGAATQSASSERTTSGTVAVHE
jgi:hypothetical protein